MYTAKAPHAPSVPAIPTFPGDFAPSVSPSAIVTPRAHILRLKDAIHPGEVTTPVRRVCYIAQLVLSGDADPAEARPQLLRGIEQLSQVLTDPDSRAHLDQATSAVLAEQTYEALKALRALLPREARLLASAGAA